jgi:DNA polymerase-3 subunit delta'
VPQHPDVILVERGLYPPEVIGKSGSETQDISVNQIRSVVLAHAAYAPHEGRARVFIIRRADELSNSAANALLKTLEEPGAGTHFILLTSRPSRLISTVRSRSFRIRFNALPRAILLDLLLAKGVGQDRANEVVDLAAGSASLALKLADPDASSERNAFVQAAIDALHSKDAASSLALAESRSKDKRILRENLEALAARLARMAHSETLANEARAPIDASRYQIVLQAMRELDRNASPALLIESMMLRMRAASE